MQRLDSISKSPIYAAFTEALHGYSTIGAFGAGTRFATANRAAIDANMSVKMVVVASNRWIGLRLEFLGNLVTLMAALLAVSSAAIAKGQQASQESDTDHHLRAGLAGLALAYMAGVKDTLNWLVRLGTQLETQMVNAMRDAFVCQTLDA